MAQRPIGIFDSGTGGISIWSSLVTLLPHESTIYIGDHAHNPYSEKSATFIKERAYALASFLVNKNVKMLVVACNTVTVTNIEYLRSQFPTIPIVGVVPVIKTAAEKTKTHVFAVLSTVLTANSVYQKHLIEKFAPHDEVLSIGVTKLVEYIEQGEMNSPRVRAYVQEVLAPYKEKNIDIIVLGCTHFPFIKPVLEGIVGKSIMVLDSGDAVARQVQRILLNNNLYHEGTSTHHFYTTGDQKYVQNVFDALFFPSLVVTHTDIA